MADNTTLNAGTGGDVIATDDISGVKHQLVKIEYGIADSATPVSTTNPLPVSLANTAANATAVKVDGSAVTQPVSGSVSASCSGTVAATQSGTWNVGTVSTVTNVVHVDDNASTVSVDDGAGSLTVDNGGTFAVQAAQSGTWTVQPGNTANTTAWKVDGSAVTQPVSGTVTTAPPSNASTNVAQLAGTTTDTNSGAKSAGTLRVVLATDQPALTNKLLVTPDAVTHDVGSITTAVVPGTGATNLGKAEDAAHTSADTGVMALGVRESSPTDLSAGNTNGDYEPFQVGKNGGVWTSLSTEPQGGWTVATGSIAATKTDIGTANTAGCVGGWYFYNSNASVAYVQFFNTQASGVTLGSTAPVYSLGIPAASAANLMSENGIQHSTAISIAVTTTRAGSTGPGATVDYNIWYKQ
jgi:hypothetical protein